MSSATSEVVFRLAAATYSQSAGRVTKFCTDEAPRASMVFGLLSAGFVGSVRGYL